MNDLSPFKVLLNEYRPDFPRRHFPNEPLIFFIWHNLQTHPKQGRQNFSLCFSEARCIWHKFLRPLHQSSFAFSSPIILPDCSSALRWHSKAKPTTKKKDEEEEEKEDWNHFTVETWKKRRKSLAGSSRMFILINVGCTTISSSSSACLSVFFLP